MSVTVLSSITNAGGSTTTSSAATYSLDGIVQATCTNGVGATRPCRARLLLSADGGATYLVAARQEFSSADSASSQVVFALGDYSGLRTSSPDYYVGTTLPAPVGAIPRDFAPPWTHFAIKFSGNEGAAVTVSATQDSRAASAPHLTLFTSSGTYTIPSWANFIRVIGIGAGGGGGSGSRGATSLPGGGGGAGGACVDITYLASDLIAANGSSDVTVVIGAGGVGAPAITTDSTGGAQTTLGNPTTFGDVLKAPGAGISAAPAGSRGRAATAGSFLGSDGGTGSATVAGTVGVNSASLGGAGGGAGGGLDAGAAVLLAGDGGSAQLVVSATAAAGGAHGVAGSTGVDATDGGNGTTITLLPSLMAGGSGGGGGAATPDNTTQPGKGGNGGGYGAGGGGGPAILNGTTLIGEAGKGGDGAPGAMIVMAW